MQHAQKELHFISYCHVANDLPHNSDGRRSNKTTNVRKLLQILTLCMQRFSFGIYYFALYLKH